MARITNSKLLVVHWLSKGTIHILVIFHIHPGTYQSVSVGLTGPWPVHHWLSILGGAQEEKYTIVVVNSGSGRNVGKILEEVEESRAMFEVYEGGVVSACLVYNPIKIDNVP